MVVGVGQPLRGDDGVGPLVAGLVRQARLAGVEVRETRGDLLSLASVWRDYALVIIVDAADTGGPPGTLTRLEAHAGVLPAQVRPSCSSHGVGLAEAVELARTLGTLPPRLIIFAVAGQDFSLGAPVSPEVAAGAQRAVAAVLEELAAAGWEEQSPPID
ncbi:MAG: hydrogenase maturation protease [Deltaproteobacteria bacterium]|nr:hydrogenase maturation protease [Deltaproteobacteria bacterium]